MKTVNWKRLNGKVEVAHVLHHIAYDNMCALAIAVKDKVFEGGIYRPYRLELDLVWQILASYTDIRFEDVNEMMEEYQYGELRRKIWKAIDRRQLKQVYCLVQEMINYELSKTGMDRLGALLTGLIAQEVKQNAPEADEQ